MTEFQYALLKSTSYGWLCGKELSFKAEIDGVADVNDRLLTFPCLQDLCGSS